MVEETVIAALASTAIISLAPNVLLVLFPQYASGDGINSPFLTLGQALAAGALLGDVFLHTLPHALMGGHDGDDSHNVGLWVLAGFSIFLIADMLLRSLGKGHDHHDSPKTKEKADGHPHHHNKTSTILLNLVADAMHNFTDGLAIGASFSSLPKNNSAVSIWSLMQSRGGLATLSILFHEIPHELGDFAILVKSGFSKQQAILAQLGTAIAAMIGTIVGITLQHSVFLPGDSLLFITAGGFVYLSACTILPEILEDHNATFRLRVMQIASFAVGVAFLYAVACLEEMGEHNGHSHHHHDHGHEFQHTPLMEAPDHHHHHVHTHHDHVAAEHSHVSSEDPMHHVHSEHDHHHHHEL